MPISSMIRLRISFTFSSAFCRASVIKILKRKSLVSRIKFLFSWMRIYLRQLFSLVDIVRQSITFRLSISQAAKWRARLHVHMDAMGLFLLRPFRWCELHRLLHLTAYRLLLISRTQAQRRMFSVVLLYLFRPNGQ